MLDTLKGFFGMQTKADLGAVITEGAIIVDVRTKAEYDRGHITGSINLPLDQLNKGMNKLDKNKAIITCCASGMRSGVAKGMLQKAGFARVYNGGPWPNVANLLP